MKRRSSLIVKLARGLRWRPLAGPGVVAVSGGPDSVALLRALIDVRPAGDETPLVMAHLNHQLRGEESDADEEFVHGLHAALSSATPFPLGLRCDRIDVRAAAAAAGENLEATARRLRYDWLAGVARVAGCAWVATGHTADDQAETVLHRLIRGAGIQGLRGIAPRRPLAEGVELVRPLLEVTRAEVLAYLEKIDQPARRDSSNDDPRLTRNRIRRELLPLLTRSYNPAIVAVLTRLAEQAQATFAEEQQQAEALAAEAELPRAGPWLVFDRRRLAETGRHRVRAMFRFIWRREGWPVGRMSAAHWDRLAALVYDEVRAAELPAGIRASVRDRTLLVGLPPQ